MFLTYISLFLQRSDIYKTVFKDINILVDYSIDVHYKKISNFNIQNIRKIKIINLIKLLQDKMKLINSQILDKSYVQLKSVVYCSKIMKLISYKRFGRLMILTIISVTSNKFKITKNIHVRRLESWPLKQI